MASSDQIFSRPMGRDEIKRILQPIAEKDPYSVSLFAARAAARVLPRLIEKDKFAFHEEGKKHFVACWRAVYLVEWLAFNKSRAGHAYAYASSSETLTNDLDQLVEGRSLEQIPLWL